MRGVRGGAREEARGQRPCRFHPRARAPPSARDRSCLFEKPVGWARWRDGVFGGDARRASPGRRRTYLTMNALSLSIWSRETSRRAVEGTPSSSICGRGAGRRGVVVRKGVGAFPSRGDSRRCAEKACPRFRRSREAGSAARGSRIRGCRTHLETSLLQRHESARASLPGLVHLAVGALPNLLQLFIRLVDGVPHRDGLPTSRSVRRCASVSRGPRCVCVRDKERPMREAGGRSSVRSGRSAARGRRRSARPRFSSSRARGNIPVSGVPVKAHLTECPYASRASGVKRGTAPVFAVFKRFSRTRSASGVSRSETRRTSKRGRLTTRREQETPSRSSRALTARRARARGDSGSRWTTRREC